MLMLWATIGLLVGGIIGAIIMATMIRGRNAESLQQLQEGFERDRQRVEASHQQAVGELGKELASRGEAMAQLNKELVDTGKKLGEAEQEKKNLTERLERQREELEQLNERMTKEFKLIANQLMDEKGKQLSEMQEGKLNLLLNPFKEQILNFEKQVREAYDKEGKERFALKAEVAKLVEQNQQLSKDADNLAKALKGDSQAQGAWGEMILEKLLEDSGLMKGQEYSMQESTTMADGSRLRPDAVIHLPENKALIIDSKVSLLDYDRYRAATDPDERKRLLRAHVESMRNHAKELAVKNYPKLYGLDSVDFVLMFVPIEPAFLLALRERPEIFQEAYDKQVVMVTHSTLMATLRTVHGLWKNERIAQNHLEIAKRAGALYDKFVGFTESLGTIGKHVNSARDSYEKALSQLTDGRGSLVRQVEMLKELGAKTNKEIHQKLLHRAQEETQE